MVSLDRFIASTKPNLYYRLGTTYAKIMCIGILYNINFIFIFQVIYSICAITLLVTLLMAVAENGKLNLSPYCGVSNAINPILWPYIRSLRIIGTSLGIILYIPIFYSLVILTLKSNFFFLFFP